MGQKVAYKVRPVSGIDKVAFIIYRGTLYFLALDMAALLVIMVVGVFCRYVLNAALPWIFEICRYLMIWLVFTGAGAAFYKGEHIAMEFVLTKLPIRAGLVVLILIKLGLLGFSVVLMVTGTVVALRMAHVVTLIVGVPLIFPRLAVPVGGAIMFICVLSSLLKDIVSLRKGVKAESHSSAKIELFNAKT